MLLFVVKNIVPFLLLFIVADHYQFPTVDYFILLNAFTEFKLAQINTYCDHLLGCNSLFGSHKYKVLDWPMVNFHLIFVLCVGKCTVCCKTFLGKMTVMITVHYRPALLFVSCAQFE